MGQLMDGGIGMGMAMLAGAPNVFRWSRPAERVQDIVDLQTGAMSGEGITQHKGKRSGHRNHLAPDESGSLLFHGNPIEGMMILLGMSSSTTLDTFATSSRNIHGSFVINGNTTIAVTSPGGSPGTHRGCTNDCAHHGRCVGSRCICIPGWSGDHCQIETGWCIDNCRGRGVCKQTKTNSSGLKVGGAIGRYSYACECFDGFEGDNCAIVSLESPCPLGCSSHGTCHHATGICMCSPGFSGPDCSEIVLDTCQSRCSGRGSCLHGQCICDPAWTGGGCGRMEIHGGCPNHCSAHGDCVAGACVCEAGYGNIDCSAVVQLPPSGSYGCPEGCSGRGVCVRGMCMCAPGWHGGKCDLTYGGCYMHCSGHGICGEGGECHCLSGFEGVGCEIGVGADECKDDCNGLGQCLLNNTWHMLGIAGSCDCYDNSVAIGPACNEIPRETVLREACQNNCSGHGMCRNGRCECFGSHSGNDCSHASTACYRSDNCSGHGVCLGGSCSCVRGYAGDACTDHVKVCPNDCSGRGACVDGKCQCVPEWRGIDCNTTCPNSCSGNGRCLKGLVCECEAPFSGPACEWDSSCANDCNGRGTCIASSCLCHPGSGGEDCSHNTPDDFTIAPVCHSNCTGRGICEWEGGQPGKRDGWVETCLCDKEWGGLDCSTRVLGHPFDLRCSEETDGEDPACSH